MANPNWLPAILDLNPWTEDTYDMLYDIFKNDFVPGTLIYDGYNVWYFPDMDGGREIIFWHLTGTGEARVPELRRAERLPWAKILLDNYSKPEILNWDFEEADGDIKTYLWLKDHDYVLIMKKYPDNRRRLITAFYVNYQNTKRKLSKKYDNKI